MKLQDKKIVHGKKSPSVKIIKGESGILKDTSEDAMLKEFNVAMTPSIQLEHSLEKIEDEVFARESNLALTDLKFAISSIQNLQSQIKSDLTKTPVQQLDTLSHKSKDMFLRIEKAVTAIDARALNNRNVAINELFTEQNKTLNTIETQMMPQLVTALSKQDASLTDFISTPSSAKVTLHIMEHFPQLIKSQMQSPDELQGLQKDVNAKYSPTAHSNVSKYQEIMTSTRGYISALSQAKENILPSTALETITKLKVGAKNV